MWPIKEKENRQVLMKWPNIIIIIKYSKLAVRMLRYGSLINIIPYGEKE